MSVDPIKPEVKAQWLTFNEPFEGRCDFMYLDQRGLVTTGVGNLIEPLSAALALPWQRIDGSRASGTDITWSWHAVKARADLCMRGGGAYKVLTSIRLPAHAVDDLVFTRLHQMGGTIQAAHPCFAGLPVDAQVAILSMAWAMGPAFRFPHFWRAIEAGDYETAAEECTIHPDAGTVALRNKANAARLRACSFPAGTKSGGV